MKQLILTAALAAVLHITPAVVLVKRPDAVQALLPGADAYLAREVHLSNLDAQRLHQVVDWSPEDGVLTLYTGKAGATASARSSSCAWTRRTGRSRWRSGLRRRARCAA